MILMEIKTIYLNIKNNRIKLSFYITGVIAV
jgi:hypothetical protein